jgi:site-specific DNA-methyltransferase (adenine-specific)
MMTSNSVTEIKKGSQEWLTPPEVFDPLNEEFNFDLDPCTTRDNHLDTPYYFTKEDDGLTRDWGSYRNIFINPPYGFSEKEDGSRKEYLLEKWVRKAYEEIQIHKHIENIVMLVPAVVSTKWFHQWIWNDEENEPMWSEEFNFKVEIRFPKSRIKYLDETGTRRQSPHFDSMIIIFSRLYEPE